LKWFLFISFTTIIYSQGIELKINEPERWFENEHIIPVFSLSHSVVSGFSAFHQMRDRHFYKTGNQELKKHHNRMWHITGGIELSLSIGFGIFSGLKNKENIYGYIKDVLLFSGIRWFVRDGVYNLLNGNAWFYQSPNTTAILDPLGTWYVKTIYLMGVIIIYYLL